MEWTSAILVTRVKCPVGNAWSMMKDDYLRVSAGGEPHFLHKPLDRPFEVEFGFLVNNRRTIALCIKYSTYLIDVLENFPFESNLKSLHAREGRCRFPK